MNKIITFVIISLFFVTQIAAQQKLYRVQNADEECGYINSKGDTIVPIGKYLLCQDSIIKTIGFVYGNKGIFCINTQGKELFEVFNYDNGPDIASNGLFRIVKDGKIGYANTKGQIVIQPQFRCAWPFEKGKAQVSYNCNIVQEGEIKLWKEGDWFYIDKTGKRIKL
jgi:hypothetical protein